MMETVQFYYTSVVVRWSAHGIGFLNKKSSILPEQQIITQHRVTSLSCPSPFFCGIKMERSTIQLVIWPVNMVNNNFDCFCLLRKKRREKKTNELYNVKVCFISLSRVCSTKMDPECFLIVFWISTCVI